MILFNDFKRQWADLGAQLTCALTAVGESGWYILGEEVRQFERALAERCRMQYAVGVASGLDALEISLRVLGCRAGDKVLTTSISAFATSLAILKLGAIPVYVDCDEYGLADLVECRRALERDRTIRFFVPVHLYGHAMDSQELTALRDDFSLTVVEDCAQSILACAQGRPAGSIGQAAATSFYPTKNLGAIGDGGAILTNDAGVAEKARALRDYGQSSKYRHDALGYNSRLDEVQAAFLGRVFLPKLAEWTTRRREIAGRYMTHIDNAAICKPGSPAHSTSVWHLFPTLVDPACKSGFMQHLRNHGVGYAEHYPIAMMDQPVMTDAPHEVVGSCHRARRWCGGEVSLPIHPYLMDGEIDRVVEVCNEWEA